MKEKLVLSLWSILCMKMVSQCVGWSGIRPIRARLVRISQCQIREKEFSLFKRFQTERHSKNTTEKKLKWELFEILPSNDHKAKVAIQFAGKNCYRIRFKLRMSGAPYNYDYILKYIIIGDQVNQRNIAWQHLLHTHCTG